jgi:hypothetical protein
MKKSGIRTIMPYKNTEGHINLSQFGKNLVLNFITFPSTHIINFIPS